MRTEIVPVNAATLARAASLLRAGEVVAFPTETVYGLGANTFDAASVAKIFAAKARPADNPLISHIADLAQMDALVARVPEQARPLMAAFWPGPLTLIFQRAKGVPDIVSAGLSTVSVRMPAHPAAQALIRQAGCPIAAPSANRSGRPSPTTAEHVLADMDSRIPLILDGGPCGFGVESTVLDLTGDVPAILRPGGVTFEMLSPYLPGLQVDDAVLRPLQEGALARSPGMKHRHYAPRGQVVVLRGKPDAVALRTKALYDKALDEGKRVAILCSRALSGDYEGRQIRVLGADAGEMAANLYDALRGLDAEGMELILTEATDTGGMGLALMNRLLRAADFDVMDV